MLKAEKEDGVLRSPRGGNSGPSPARPSWKKALTDKGGAPIRFAVTQILISALQGREEKKTPQRAQKKTKGGRPSVLSLLRASSWFTIYFEATGAKKRVEVEGETKRPIAMKDVRFFVARHELLFSLRRHGTRRKF